MNETQQHLWEEMLKKSWQPRQWFDDEKPTSDYESNETREAKIMWVYKRSEVGFTVGYYSPDREWHAESDHPTREQAAARVRWLNGGNS